MCFLFPIFYISKLESILEAMHTVNDQNVKLKKRKKRRGSSWRGDWKNRMRMGSDESVASVAATKKGA
jgi:hypothetical protein